MEQASLVKMLVVLPILAYVIGSIPFGLLLGLVRGVDIRKDGSGNIGSTNVSRLIGRRWGVTCFLLDMAKGLAPMLWAGSYLRRTDGGAGANGTLSQAAQIAWLCVGVGCILGHMFSVYLRFRGGKGVATSLGVVLGVWPFFTYAALMAFGVWVAIWLGWRYVSLASITAAVSFPVGFGVLLWQREDWLLGQLWPLFAFGCLMPVLVIVRHRANIERLWAGTENQARPLSRSGQR